MIFDIGNSDVQQAGPDYGEPWQQPKRIGKYGIGAPPAEGPVGGPAATTPVPQQNAVIRPPVVAQPPQAPQMDTAELARRQAAVDQYSKPIDRSDPKYKLSIGGRLLRIGADFLAGMGGKQAPFKIGPGAVNSQYGIDEAARQKNLDAAQTGLKTFDTGYDEQLKGYKENLESYKQNALAIERQAKADKYDNTVDQSTLAPDDPNHPEGTWHGTTPGGQQKTGLPAPKWWQQENAREDTGAKLQAQIDSRTKVADQLKLTGDDRKFFIANGKLREPNPDAEARNRQTNISHADSEADRRQREADMNYNRYQDRLARYNAKKADITQREKDAYANLERQSRDRDGKIKDPAALESGKATLQKQFADEYNALGPEPQEPTDRTQGPNQTKAAAAKSQPAGNQKMIQVQIPGKPPGQIPASRQRDFLKKYPNAKVIG